MRRPSYSVVTSTLALIVALSGGAYAFSLPDGSVDTRHLKSDSVTSSKVKNGAIVGSKIKDASVQGGDLAPSAKKVFGYQEARTTPNMPIPAGEMVEATADCPNGKVAVGGGYWTSHSDIIVMWDKPKDARSWTVLAYNPSDGPREVVAHAICVNG